MNQYQKLRKAIDRLLVWERCYCAMLLILMLTLAFAQVVRRYVLRSPWSWSDEMVLFLLAWFAFPAMNLNVWNDNHFNIATLYNRFPPAAQKAADVFRHLLIGVYMAAFTGYSYQLMMQYMDKPLSVTGIPQGLKYLPVLVTNVLCVLFCAVNLIGCFVPQGPAPGKEAADG